MKNQSVKQALAEEIKREILMNLNHASEQYFQEQHLIDSIKREVLKELDQHRYQQQLYPNRDFIESVKNEALNKIRGEVPANPVTPGNQFYPDRATIESIKQEVIAQLRTEQESQEEQHTVSKQYEGEIDPALVQAVKNSVMAEINVPHYR